MTIRVLLADDQTMVRTGFRMILESEDDIVVVAEAETGGGAVSAAEALRPDVILMDIQMPIMDGLEATRRISRLPSEPGPVRVLILTTFERDEYVFESLRSGASGFMLKNASPEDLIAAVRVVAAGEALLAPSITRRVIEEFAKQPPAAPRAEHWSNLTERELDVLRLVARGRSNAEIAFELSVGEATVKSHVSNLLTKLQLRDRVQAVVHAYEHGLIRPGDHRGRP